MKKLLLLAGLFIAAPAFAGITSIGTPPLIFTSPDTALSLAAITCENWSLVTDGDLGIEYREDNCGGTPTFTKVWPFDPTHLDVSADVKSLITQSNMAAVKSTLSLGISDISGLSSALSSAATLPIAQSNVTGLVTALSGKQATITTGSTSQYIRGDLSLGTFATRSFNNAASHSIVTGTGATGFLVSSTRDAEAHYSITINTTVSLSGNATGYVALEIAPTNSATAGDWVEVGRTPSGQSGTLVIGLTLSQIGGGQIGAIIPAGYYAKLRSVNTAGTPTYNYNSGQEVLLN